MSSVTMIGCDLHDRTMLLKVAVGQNKAVKKSFSTPSVQEMIRWLKDFAARYEASRIVFAYEASGQGFGLHDELDEVRAHLLAGRKLATVWVPDAETRDDREAVRMRLQLAEQRTRIKNQIRGLAKRARLTMPGWFTRSGNWSRRSVQWLRGVAAGQVGDLGAGIRSGLASLVDLHEELCRQLAALDKVIVRLARSERYEKRFRKLTLLPGIGTLTAMTFLTELGDLDRFANRRQLAAYLGLAPSCFETGERDDRKGHITRQGPSHVRHVLCQAAWASLRCSDQWRETFNRIKRGSQKRSKIAIVAIMRRLGIQMWQVARSEQYDRMLEIIDEDKAWAAQAAGGSITTAGSD